VVKPEDTRNACGNLLENAHLEDRRRLKDDIKVDLGQN
jgi:hypothetical protein